MGLTKYKLGELITQVDRKNLDLVYGIDDVRGVSNTKEIRPTKANVDNRSFDKFSIVEPNEFVFNRRTTRNGERLGLGFNNTDRAFIFTEDYVVFSIGEKAKQTLLPEYLYIYFLRDEFDRYVRYNSWGSATEFFNWEEMCEVPILLPELPIQQKAVDAYKALQDNLAAYTDGLDDLKLTCQAYIEKLAKEYPAEEIGGYIEESDLRNVGLKVKLAQGISNRKYFQNPVQVGENKRAAKVVHDGEFAWNKATTRNGEKISIALRNGETCFVSSAYGVFRLKDKEVLVPEYLMLWFNRPEFDRYARYHSKGSAHEFFEFLDMCQVKIPIPPKEIQQSIVDIYHAQYERQNIAEKLNQILKDSCPVLIRQSLSN